MKKTYRKTIISATCLDCPKKFKDDKDVLFASEHHARDHKHLVRTSMTTLCDYNGRQNACEIPVKSP